MVPLLLEFQHVADTCADGLEVGHGAAQPTLVHVQHAATFGFTLDNFLGLALGSYEQDFAALGHKVHHLLIDIVNHAQGLLQVNDVDAVSLGEDVLLHGGVPPPGLMPEVDARLEKGFHGEMFSNGGCRGRGGNGFRRGGWFSSSSCGRNRGCLCRLGCFRCWLFR